jgi:hypothetical protein
MYQYRSNDGLCQSDNYNAINLWNSIVLEQKYKERDWIDDLKSKGVKAAHPDDGWIDRKENSIYFAYPQFNEGVQINDIIALGDEDKYRLVKVIDIKKGVFNQDRYYFVDV